MQPDPTFQKRIKRRVVARDQRFFAAAAPGLNRLCRRELASPPLSMTAARSVAGGVEFSGHLSDCYAANLRLRTAGRILMRLATFEADRFALLEKAAVQIPWELFLYADCPLRIEVTTRKCRLHHSGAIQERFERAVSQRLQSEGRRRPNGGGHQQALFVRGAKDRFTVSLDSSGELLYKRGLKTHYGKAPLRETLAAAVLMLAGYDGTQPLVDPMCGSGTFSLEAALMAARIAPGWHRSFAFMQWPSFQPGRWEHIRRVAAREIRSITAPRVFASDRDPEACQQLTACLHRHGLDAAVTVNRIDFEQLNPRDLTGRPGVVVLNPPYDRRLPTDRSPEELFTRIGTILVRHYPGWRTALLLPHPALAERLPFRLSSHYLVHGGMRLQVLTGKIPVSISR